MISFAQPVYFVNSCKYPSLVLILLISFSCNYLVGYKKIKKVEPERISSTCIKYKIEECLISDAFYIERIMHFYNDSLILKDLIQPLQIHYFIDSLLVSSLVNCYIEPKYISDLDWNHNNRLSEFPPKSLVNLNKATTLEDYLSFVTDLPIKKSKNVVVIVWTSAFKKKSRHLINLVTTKMKEIKEKEILIYAVNLDQVYLNFK